MGRPWFYLGSYPDLGRAMRAPTMNFADGFGLFAKFRTNEPNKRKASPRWGEAQAPQSTFGTFYAVTEGD